MRSIILLILSLLVAFTLSAGKSTRFPNEPVQIERQLTNPVQPQAPNYQAILSESFEGSFPPAGWTKISNGNANEEWVVTNRNARTGTHSAAIFYSSASETMDEWLVTPALDLSNQSRARLVFYETAESWDDYGVEHAVKVSTTSPTDVSTFKSVLSMTRSNHQVSSFNGAPIIVDLTEFAGKATVYIAFFYRGSDADNWYIDDVEVLIPSENDVEVLNLLLQKHYDVGATIAPAATVANAGKNPASFSIDFGYFGWDENQVILGTKTVENLAAGASQKIVFDNFTFTHEIEYTFFAQTHLVGDEDSRNDQITKTVNSFSKTKTMVLVEKGTGTWCQYCPGSAKAVDLLHQQHYDSLAVLEYHNGDVFETSLTNERLNYYNISAFPTAVFGGTHVYVGGAAYNVDFMPIYYVFEDLYQTILTEKTAFSLELFLGTGRATRFPVYVRTTFEAETFGKSYRLFLGLNESHFGIQWQGMDSLHFVARSIQPTLEGLPVWDSATPPALGQSKMDTIDFKLPTSVIKKNTHLIAFIQNTATKEIMAAAKIDFANPPAPLAVDGQSNPAPRFFTVEQNYPNPFNPETWIQFTTTGTADALLAIYNLQGQRVCTLAEQKFSPGSHTVRWDGKNQFGQDVASGLYFLRATEAAHSQVIKLIKMK